jgi:hypothetical protein
MFWSESPEEVVRARMRRLLHRLHRRGDRAVRIGAGRHLASHIAQARFVELDGADHWAFAGDQKPVLTNIKQFVGGLVREPDLPR